MSQSEWDELFASLRRTRDIVAGWPPVPPDLTAVRCEQSRHRTLAHLRTCQEQWLIVANEFLARYNPNVTILHPWRKFDQAGYAALPWSDHLTQFLREREQWLELHSADWNRGGKWNRKPDTIGGLTQRLANHEAYHVSTLRG
jgi:hypothetical protein